MLGAFVALLSCPVFITGAWAEEKQSDFAGPLPPNLILNPGFESDSNDAIVGNVSPEEAHFIAHGDGLPDDWNCKNAILDTEVAHSGRSSVRLSAPGGTLSSSNTICRGQTVTTLLPRGVPVLLSAWSRAENAPQGSAYNLQCNIGGKSWTLEFSPGTHDWEQKSLLVVPESDFILPSVNITFQAPEGSGAKVWFDDIYLGQLHPYPNLAVNPGFELGRAKGNRLPEGWSKLPEDYLANWGGYYWPASLDTLMSHSGKASMRCDAASGQTGGAAQTISLRQKEARPIIVGAYCRAENLIADNFCVLDADVWYDNGKKELEVGKAILGRAAHDWDYRTFTIVPKRPVDHLVVKVENKATLRTTTVWIDDLYVAEMGSTRAELRTRQLALPAEIDCAPLAAGEQPTIDGKLEAGLCGSGWWPVGDAQNSSPMSPAPGVSLANDKDNLYLFLASQADRMEVMLSPFGPPDYDSIEPIAFYRFTISRDGSSAAQAAIDRDGYAFYLPADFSPYNWEAKRVVRSEQSATPTAWTAEMRIPFAALGVNPPSGGEQWRLNIAAINNHDPLDSEDDAQPICWAGTYDNVRDFGSLKFLPPKELELSDLSFGDGLPDGLTITPTWITRGDVAWGDNIFHATLTNRSSSLQSLACELHPEPSAGERPSDGSTSPAGTALSASIEPGKSWDLALPYHITSSGRQQLRLTLTDTTSGKVAARATFPINVPSPVQLHTDQLFYYPDEKQAHLDIACPYLPADKPSSLRVRLISETTNETLLDNQVSAERQVSFGMDISSLPISPEPDKEFRCQVDLIQGDATLASASTTFGRLERPQFAPQPPVEKVEISPDGTLLVNGKPYLPIIASLQNVKAYPRASAMGFNAEKDNIPDGKSLKDVKARMDDAQHRNVYFVVSDYQSNQAKRDAVTLMARDHPFVLEYVGSEVTYDYNGYFSEGGRLDFYRRQALDPIHPMFWEYEGGSGSWYGRTLGAPSLGQVIQVSGMVTDGPLGRMMPRNVDLERAAATHPEQIQVVIVPQRETRGDYLMPGGWGLYARSFPWTPYEQLHCSIYISIIHGARGMYYYAPANDNQIDEARGLALELRLLSPVILAPSSPRTVTLSPARNHIDVLEKKYEGKTYLITCNRSEEPDTVEFRLPNLSPETPIARRFEPQRPLQRTADGKAFQDNFGPYDVHIYVIG
jgi:hypothetical protein